MSTKIDWFHLVVYHSVLGKSGVVVDVQNDGADLRVKWSEGCEVSGLLPSNEFKIVDEGYRLSHLRSSRMIC